MIFKSYEEVVSEYHLEQIVNNIKNRIINMSGSDDIKFLVNDRNCKVDIISKITSLNKSKGSMLIEAACVIHNEITVPKNINKIMPEISFSKLVVQTINFYTRVFRVLFGGELRHRYSRKQNVRASEELSDHMKRDLGL